VSYTSITDNALSLLTRVEDLDVSHCPYVTGEAFTTLRNLKSLTAPSCPLLDGSYLVGLFKLENLSVGKCPGVLDEHIGDLRLHSLCVTDNKQIKVIPPGIKSVWMSNCGVTTLTVQNVEMLCVSPDIVTDAAISKLGGVKHFIISGREFLVRDIPYDEPICRLTNVGLKYLAGIECLGLNKFPCPGVTDAGFAHLGSLVKLSIVRWSNLTDAALEWLPNLQDLNISECEGIVGTFIPKLKKLENLDVSYAWSFDVDNLVLPSRMITLDVSGLRITDEHVARFPKGLSHLIMGSCELITEASIPHCLGLEFLEIVDCDNIKLTEAVKEQLRKIPDVYFGWVE
jgi:Leucine-rich repeat (LRR) protein